jgi:histidinol-phosphate aminotransferase
VQRPPMFGAMMSPGEIDELAAAFPRAQFVIDEAYLNYGEPGCSAAAIAVSRDNVLVLCGLSKGYGAGGLRVAFALAAQEMLADLKDWLAPLQISSASALAARSILRRSGGLGAIRIRLRAAKQCIERALTAAGIRMLPTDDVAPWICCRPDTESPVGWFASRGVLVRAIQAPDGLPAARLFPPLSDSDIAIFEKRVGE